MAKTPRLSVAQAKTGTGKTLAFLVPIVQRIIAEQPELAAAGRTRARADDIRAIILSPTRELAEQIGAEAAKLCRNTGVVVQTAVGGTQKNEMLRRTRFQGCHLMIATPGRLHDLLSDPTSGIAAPRLAALVLDEADRMLEHGFKMELEDILKYVPSRDEVPRQTLLYSATLPKNVVGLARQFVNPTNFEFVQTVKADEVPTHQRVPQFIVPCHGFENLPPTLLELIRRDVEAAKSDPSKTPFKAIVFLPTTAAVVSYSYMFRRIKYQDRSMPFILDIHSKLSQQSRTRNADQFRNADSAILFSSDVSARGMDFPNVTHVIQLHLPQDREIYIHRIGRTGRAGKEGVAYTLVSDIEIPAARNRLPGLPIQRCTDFENASMDVSQLPQLPPLWTEIQEASQKIPQEVMSDTYRGFLGNALREVNRKDVIDEVNNMARYTWGLDGPPTSGGGRSSRDDLDGRGGRGGYGDRDGRGRGGDRGGFGGRGRDGGRGRPEDGFESMERQSREFTRGGRGQRREPPAF